MTPFLIALMIAAGEPQATPPPPQPAPATTDTETDDEDEAQTPRLTSGKPGETITPLIPSGGYASSGYSPMATLETRPIVRPFVMPAYTPVGPMAYASVTASPVARALTVDEYHGAYEAPKSAMDQYYEQGVRSHFQAEQAMMGALDGQWTIASTDGVPLMSVILIDPGGGGPLQGAWRDLKPGAKGANVFDTVARDRTSLVLSFRREGAAAPDILTLKPGASGWSGDLVDGTMRQTVIMIRPAPAPQS